jgi:chromosome segregation ATPase
MTVDERLDKLTGIVETLANTVVAHDNQIEALLKIAESHDRRIESHDRRIESHDRRIEALLKIAGDQEKGLQGYKLQIEALFQMAERNEKTWQDLQRQWQAYLNTLPKQ